MEKVNEPSQQEQTPEMTLLAHSMVLEKRISEGIFKLLLCRLEDLPATFILQLQRDLDEWYEVQGLSHENPDSTPIITDEEAEGQ